MVPEWATRAERSGKGDGRVDHVNFTASGPGVTCNGSVTVKVPKDMSPKTVTGDGGALYDSTH